jgi:beta-N-acetylhexosaminidase
MTEKLGALIVDLKGNELTPEEKEILAHPLVGGVVLFTRNYESRRQLKQLTESIASTRETPLLMMVDQEGGRVQRFIPEFTRLPPMAYFGSLYDENPPLALKKLEETGYVLAEELRSTGIDINFAPVLDLKRHDHNAIGDRALHRNPEVVSLLAAHFIQGMKRANMQSIGKHFPGHGAVTVDSHQSMPIDERQFAEIEKDDLVPFITLIQSGLSAIMAAHILFPAVDAQPVSYSRHWLKRVLRRQLKFAGVIFSDDLNMEGANISANYADRVIAAREAGCDFALLCNQRQGVIETLDKVPYRYHQLDQSKWAIFKNNYHIASVV